MKRQSRTPMDNPSRCSHIFPSGRRCRLPIAGSDSPFCHRHRPKYDPAADLIHDLSEAAGSLSTPEEIHRFLTRVTLLRIQGRLTPKESCVYAYLCMILQRGQREIAFHQKLRDDRAQREAEKDTSVDWSIPRPGDDDDSSDSPAVEISLAGAELARPSESAAPSAATNASVELSPPRGSLGEGGPASPVSPQTSKSAVPSSESPRAYYGASSESFASSTSLTPSTSCPSRDFYNHFFPIDPTLPSGLQDPRKNIPPPDEAECRRLAARRGLNFHRRGSPKGFLR